MAFHGTVDVFTAMFTLLKAPRDKSQCPDFENLVTLQTFTTTYLATDSKYKQTGCCSCNPGRRCIDNA
jgi:hypothetical protein